MRACAARTASPARTAPPRNVECVGSQHDVGHVRRSAAPPALTMKESRERETMDHPRGGPAALTHTRTLCSLSIPPDPTEVGVLASSSARPCGRWWRSNTLSPRAVRAVHSGVRHSSRFYRYATLSLFCGCVVVWVVLNKHRCCLLGVRRCSTPTLERVHV